MEMLIYIIWREKGRSLTSCMFILQVVGEGATHNANDLVADDFDDVEDDFEVAKPERGADERSNFNIPWQAATTTGWISKHGGFSNANPPPHEDVCKTI